jgi:hypothetical protein
MPHRNPKSTPRKRKTFPKAHFGNVRASQTQLPTRCHPEEAQAFAKRRPADEGSMYSAPNFYYVYIMTNRSKTPTQASLGIWNNVCSNTIKASRVNSRRAQDRPSCLLRAFRGSTLGDWRGPRLVHIISAGGFIPPRSPARWHQLMTETRFQEFSRRYDGYGFVLM